MSEFHKIFDAVKKTLGFFVISCIPIVIHIIKYGIANDGIIPQTYQSYAIQIISFCFPVLATTLWIGGKDLISGIKYTAIILSLFSCIYMAFSDAVCNLKDQALHTFFCIFSVIIYLGTIIISVTNDYYDSEEADQNRRMQQDDTQKKVIWRKGR